MFPDLRHPKVYCALLLLSAFLWLPLISQSPFIYHLFILIAIYGALSTAWNLVGGFAGQLSLGHAVFYGIGSYTAVLMVVNFNITPWLGMLVGMILSAGMAIAVSYPTLRLRGPFFTLATIAMLEVVRLLTIHMNHWTGGSAGLSVPLNIGLKWMIFRERGPYLLIAFGFLLLILWLSWLVRTSRFGFYLVAIKEREDAALAVGVNATRAKILVAIISAMLTSMVGSFHAMYLTFVEPSAIFSLELSVQIAMFALIGGLGSLAGPLAGAILVVPIAEIARGWLSSFGSGTHGFIYGLILVVVVLTMPEGMVGRFGRRIQQGINRLPYLGKVKVPQKGTTNFKPMAIESGKVVLQAEHLHKAFGGLVVIDDLSLALHSGEILGIIGPNGAGKTTLFNQLSGFLAPDRGQVRILGRDHQTMICPKTPNNFALAGVGRTFQIAQPFTSMSVLENIMLGAFLHTANPEKAKHLAYEVAELTDLTELLALEAKNMTVGGLKRLEIARALATQPQILLFDEVMAGLNPTDVEKTVAIIRKIRDFGIAILLIEHVMQAIMSLSDRVIAINGGGIIASGSPQAVVANNAVIEAYLGQKYRKGGDDTYVDGT